MEGGDQIPCSALGQMGKLMELWMEQKFTFLPLTTFSLFSSQRDLDFTFELDFKGQLCEAAIAHDYKMR